MMSKKTVVSLVASVLILGGGLALTVAMWVLMPEAEKVPVEEVAILVDAVEATPSNAPAMIEASGSVAADQQVMVSPEVAGRVASVSDELVPGGRFAKGQVLFRVDSRTYEAQVTQRQAQVAQAELEVQLEQGRQRIAEREWALLGSAQEGANADIALRKPQLASVLAQLESARAALAQAELDLERTAVRAPFNAVVVSESVDVGQVVNAASQAVMLVGTDRARVQVQVPVEQLAFLSIPGVNDASEGSRAWVRQSLGGGAVVERPAQLHRLVGQLDPQTRSASLVLMVEDPQAGDGLPLLPGAYVSVEIEGKPIDNGIQVVRRALYDGDTVWVADAEDRLERRSVKVGHRGPEHVVVIDGLKPGERIVTSALSMPLNGTRVRFSGDGDAEAAADPSAGE